MKLLMIGHLLGDFYFQSDNLAREKKKSLWNTVKHCLYYTITMSVILYIGTGKLSVSLFYGLLIGVSHLLVDGVKYIINKKFNSKEEFKIFVIDQLIHIAIIFVFSRLYTIEYNFIWFSGIPEYILNNIQKVLSIICAFLLCGKPAALTISLVFGLIPKTIEKADSSNVILMDSLKQENVKIGSWIGILEREIILILGLLGQFGAIGFVLAAKSIVRHSQLNEPAFAEK